jgi:hypothetical protein
MIAASPKYIVFTRQHGTVDSWSALQIAREWSVGLAQLRMMQEKLSLPLTSIIINECHPFSSPPFGLGVMVEVLTSCTHWCFCPNLTLTTILLQSHPPAPQQDGNIFLPVHLYPLCLVSACLLTTRCCVTSANQATRVVRS